ncbi:MAG: 2-hydroxyglutaryl-CoA dehydratase, partial [Firmicutes bacterium]|nr:2-hydroxyglutaryl-CoA dehydratase [Bacillota bacterium]
MITAGIDVGSITTKAVLLNGEDWQSVIRSTGCSPREAGREAFAELMRRAGLAGEESGYVVRTGYAR